MVNPIQSDCQIKSVRLLAEGPQEPVPIRKSLRLFLRKALGPRLVRKNKIFADRFLNWLARLGNKATRPSTPPIATALPVLLITGEWVRVRPKEQIIATLNRWGQLKGCSFAPEMERYCGTRQRILKQVERFVDERDFRVLNTKGIYLLEGINCPGVASLGRCDRNCFFFWREEWLEKIDGTVS